MRPTEYLSVLCDIEAAETAADLRRVLERLQRRLERAGERRDPDQRARVARARLEQREGDLAAIEALLALLG